MNKEKISLLSNDDKTPLNGFVWTPDGAPKCVLQLVHGMVEYIDRYDAFATWLNTNDVACIGHDHLGHGESLTSEERRFHFADKGGDRIVIEDMHLFTEEAKKRFPGVPVFILGHSMGSFLVRRYIALYSNDIAGTIVMGTGFIPPVVAGLGAFLSSVVSAFKGQFYRSPFLTNLALGGNNKPFEPARTPFDWLSKNTENVDKYMADPLCGGIFTARAYHDFFTDIKLTGTLAGYDSIRKDLPVFIVSGELDPVGGAAACPKVKEAMEKKGLTDVSMKLYTGDRHEILNEDDRETVYRDIYEWLMEKLGKNDK